MINYIICDDKNEFIDGIVSVVDKTMMKNNQAYEKYIYNEYNTKFHEMIKSNLSLKIYILDIEVKDKSGIDIARKIREIDIDSMIIFITSYYDKYVQDILSNYFMFLAFIDKKNNYKVVLENTIDYALNNINRKNIIRFKSKGTVYTLCTKDIILIQREKDRTCTIKTDSNDFTVNKNLVELYEMLDNRFVYSHRACIVNKDRIKIYKKSKKQIIFDNNAMTDLVSNLFKDKVK